MIKDKILLYNDESVLGFKCKSCGDVNHTILKCPYLTYKPVKSIFIQRHLFSEPQNRRKYRRRPKSRYKYRHTLITALDVKNTVKLFQEQKLAEISYLPEFYAEHIDYLTILGEAGKDFSGVTNDDILTETRKRDESREVNTTNRDEFNTEDNNKNSPLNLNIKNPTFADIQSPYIETDMYNREDRPKNFFNFNAGNSSSFFHHGKGETPFSKELLLNEIKNEELLKYSKESLPSYSPGKYSQYLEDILNHQRNDDKKFEERKESMISISNRKQTICTKLDKSKINPVEIDYKEEFERTNVHTNKKSKAFHPLFFTDFDAGSMFTKYFPYNNKQLVLDKIQKGIKGRKDEK